MQPSGDFHSFCVGQDYCESNPPLNLSKRVITNIPPEKLTLFFSELLFLTRLYWVRTVSRKDKCACHCAQQFYGDLWCLVRGNLTLLSETRINFGCCGISWSTPLQQDEAGRSALWIQPLPSQGAVPALRLWHVTNSHVRCELD